jgi:hypothetical protein
LSLCLGLHSDPIQNLTSILGILRLLRDGFLAM